MENKVKVAYLHFSGKLPRKYEGKAIMSVALCTDYLGYDMVMNKVEAVDAETSNNKWIDVQALDYAMNYLFKLQSKLIESGVTRVFLVTDNPNLYSYIVDKPLSPVVKDWMGTIYKTYAVFGPKELKLGIGLCKLADKRNRSKTYYFEKFVENKEYFTQPVDAGNVVQTNKKKKYVFGFDNLITAKDLIGESEIEGINSLKEID